MTPTPDLAAYFRRIRFDGTPRPDLDTLERLVRGHAAAIPFENLSPLLGEAVLLDLPSIEKKLVAEGRGGYCFEHNRLLAAALAAIGFDVGMLLARVLWNRPPDTVSARTHMLLTVALPDGMRLVDVGFGGLTLTGVLRLRPTIEQATPHEPFRLLESDGLWRLEARIREAWRPLYAFDLQPQHPVDCEAPNHYLATHPESPFVAKLICARAPAGRRLALLNRQFTVHHLHGGSETRRLDDPAALREVLETEFLIRLSGMPGLLARLAALP